MLSLRGAGLTATLDVCPVRGVGHADPGGSAARLSVQLERVGVTEPVDRLEGGGELVAYVPRVNLFTQLRAAGPRSSRTG